MSTRKTNSFIKNFLVRREILEQVKAGTCELIGNPQNVKYILNGKEVSLARALADDDETT